MLKFDAVLFDCDGVLVDSEAITTGVLRDLLAEAGWELTAQECLALFVGHAVRDMAPLIEQHTGPLVTPQWLARFRQQRDLRLAAQVCAVPQLLPALHALQASLGASWERRIACASGADRPKIELMLRKTGLYPFFEGRIFSGQEQRANKPAPDVYLAAATALGVEPTRCAVIEDSVPGVCAGVAAGATVLGFAPAGDGQALLAAGARCVFADMAALPGLLQH